MRVRASSFSRRGDAASACVFAPRTTSGDGASGPLDAIDARVPVPPRTATRGRPRAASPTSRARRARCSVTTPRRAFPATAPTLARRRRAVSGVVAAAPRESAEPRRVWEKNQTPPRSVPAPDARVLVRDVGEPQRAPPRAPRLQGHRDVFADARGRSERRGGRGAHRRRPPPRRADVAAGGSVARLPPAEGLRAPRVDARPEALRDLRRSRPVRARRRARPALGRGHGFQRGRPFGSVRGGGVAAPLARRGQGGGGHRAHRRGLRVGARPVRTRGAGARDSHAPHRRKRRRDGWFGRSDCFRR